MRNLWYYYLFFSFGVIQCFQLSGQQQIHRNLRLLQSSQAAGVADSLDLKEITSWTIKTSLLEESIDYFKTNFNFTVHEHEEFHSGGELGPWSRTLIGPQNSAQDSSFCLSLVYNYGVTHYFRGNDLRYIAMRRSCYIGSELDIIKDDAGREFIDTPNLWIQLIDEPAVSPTTTSSPFLYISLHVSDLQSSLTFYSLILGAAVTRSCTHLANEPSAVLSFGRNSAQDRPSSVGIELVQLPTGEQLKRRSGSGRLHIQQDRSAARSHHGHEAAPVLADPDGHEHCIMQPSHSKPRSPAIDWSRRKGVQESVRGLAEAWSVVGPFRQRVQQVEPDSYAELIAVERDTIIELFSPWCTQCVSLKPTLEKLADILAESDRREHSDLRILALDGSNRLFNYRHSSDIALQSMLSWTRRTGFPSLFYMKRGAGLSRDVSAYDGPLHMADIAKWVSDHSGVNVEFDGLLDEGAIDSASPGIVAEEEEEEDCDECEL